MLEAAASADPSAPTMWQVVLARPLGRFDGAAATYARTRAAVPATVHPSSILRATNSAARAAALNKFVEDLRVIAGWIER